MNIPDLINQVEALTKKTGLFIKNELGKVNSGEIESKALNSLVSYVDKQAEEMLVAGLSKLLPGAGFLTEEDTIDDITKDNIWIIDPLDGTTNFLRQIPHFSVSVALETKGVVQLGFVYNIMLDEMFSAGKDHGAFMNGKKIQVSPISDFSEAIIATGFPYEKKETEPFADVLQEIMVKARGIRRFGSAALDLAYVAIGRLDAYYECCINKWDVAAGILIVEEAGGKMSDFTGGNDYLFGKQIVASNTTIHHHVLDILANNRPLT